jgi:hypothetical protein
VRPATPGPEEIQHYSTRCPGRTDDSHLEQVQAIKLRGEPYRTPEESSDAESRLDERMDSASREWATKWNGEGSAILDAAEAAIAASELPLEVGSIEFAWPTLFSQPATIRDAREKLLLSPPPREATITVVPERRDDELSLSRVKRLFLRIAAFEDWEVRVVGEGTEAIPVDQAFNAAVSALKPATLTLFENCGKPATMLRETERGVDVPTCDRCHPEDATGVAKPIPVASSPFLGPRVQRAMHPQGSTTDSPAHPGSKTRNGTPLLSACWR